MHQENHEGDKTQTYIPLIEGTMVSHCRITEKTGAGGVGEACLAENTKLKRQVELKSMPWPPASDAATRFEERTVRLI